MPSHAVVPVKCKWGWRLGFKLGVTNPTVTHSLRQALHNQYGGGFVETPTFCIETCRVSQHCTAGPQPGKNEVGNNEVYQNSLRTDNRGRTIGK